jgi:hypothetical protein
MTGGYRWGWMATLFRLRMPGETGVWRTWSNKISHLWAGQVFGTEIRLGAEKSPIDVEKFSILTRVSKHHNAKDGVSQ